MKFSKIIWVLFILLYFGSNLLAEPITIHPFMRKIPLSVPLFITESDDLNLNRDISDFLAKNLAFTGYYKIIDRGAFVGISNLKTVKGADIDFKSWTAIGTELLITGYIRKQVDLLVIDLRLFDTIKGKLLVGKRYKVRPHDYRRVVLKFCSEVVFNLTANRGIFGSKIAFVSTGTGSKEIYICDFDGGNPQRFTRNKSINILPSWSYKGNWLAYTSFADGRPAIFIKNITKSRGYKISKKGINTTPAWAPDGLKLAATLSFSGDSELYLLSGTGKIKKKLTAKWGIDTDPTWSPDGNKLAFASSRGGNPQIYVKNLQDDTITRLTFNGKYNTEPNWNPKGDKIVYSGMQKNKTHIWLIGLNGNPPRQLTFGNSRNERAVWSPDGSMIVFSSNRKGKWRLYVMTAYGTDQRQLLTMPGEQTHPSWSPRIEDQ